MTNSAKFEAIKKADKAISKAVVTELLKAGFSLSVFDGEDETQPSKNAKEILASMMQTDEDYLHVHNDGLSRMGWVRFIYGQDGWDVICDYTTNLEPWIEQGPVNELVNHFEEKL